MANPALQPVKGPGQRTASFGFNTSNRVNPRRKSNSHSQGTNFAAVSAAFEDDSRRPMAVRRNTQSRPYMHAITPPSSLLTKGLGQKADANESAIADDDEEDELAPAVLKSRQRRASEGLPKNQRSKDDLHCQKCGKSYKHSSCLTKHLFVAPSRAMRR
jgi:hypothetical protein